jgi:hypothetical protein
VKNYESGKLNTNSTINVTENFVGILNQTNESCDTRMEGIQHKNIFKKLQDIVHGQCNRSADRQLIGNWYIFIWLSKFI